MKTWMRWGTYAIGMGLALVPMTGRALEAEAREVVPEARRTLVMVQPLSLLTGQVTVDAEHAVGSHVTLAMDVQIFAALYGTEYGGTPKGANFSASRLGVGVDPGVHFYFTGHAPEGFWVGPHLELATYRQSSRDKYISVPGHSELFTLENGSRTVSYGGSVRVGYTAIVSPGLTLQASVGLAAQSSRVTPFSSRIIEAPELDVPGSSSVNRDWVVSPRMMLGLGWAF